MATNGICVSSDAVDDIRRSIIDYLYDLLVDKYHCQMINYGYSIVMIVMNDKMHYSKVWIHFLPAVSSGDDYLWVTDGDTTVAGQSNFIYQVVYCLILMLLIGNSKKFWMI